MAYGSISSHQSPVSANTRHPRLPEDVSGIFKYLNRLSTPNMCFVREQAFRECQPVLSFWILQLLLEPALPPKNGDSGLKALDDGSKQTPFAHPFLAHYYPKFYYWKSKKILTNIWYFTNRKSQQHFLPLKSHIIGVMPRRISIIHRRTVKSIAPNPSIRMT